jgi:predicted transcriptional regulator
MISSVEDVKKIRKKLGLTQTELARLAGVSQSLVAKLESRRIDPSYTKMNKILDVLKTMNKKIEPKIGDIMTKKIVFCRSGNTIPNVVHKMRRHNISQLPVLEKEAVVGLVSERVLLEAHSDHKKDIGSLRVQDVMDEPPPIVAKSTSSKVVSHLLKHFPMVIVADKGRNIGIVTKSDVLRNISKVS